MEKGKQFLYCHFFVDNTKGVIKTIKVPLESLSINLIELKEKIIKTLEAKKDCRSTNYKVLGVSKTIISKLLADSVRISNFFDNKDDIFCQVEIQIVPVKVSQVHKEDQVLKFKTLSSYSFYEANKQIVKVLVPLKDVQNLPKESIKSTFTDTSFDVKITNMNGVNYSFGVPRLQCKIVPEKSEVLTNKDNIVVRLRKEKDDDNWSSLFKMKYIGETD